MKLLAIAASVTFACDSRSLERGAQDVPLSEPDIADEETVEESAQQVKLERVEIPNDKHAYVLRGARGKERMVFLHGMCGHGLGYVQSFQSAAAVHGTIIALGGDVPCGDSEDFAKWSTDIDALDARIVAAFEASGDEEAAQRPIAIIGLSQGATRAVQLAERFPERYTRMVVIGAPRATPAAQVRRLRSAVTMAGQHEGTWQMKHSAEMLERSGVPATFVMIPDAHHAQMVEGERVMKEALDWLFSHDQDPS